jgi:hypothetical protein
MRPQVHVCGAAAVVAIEIRSASECHPGLAFVDADQSHPSQMQLCAMRSRGALGDLPQTTQHRVIPYCAMADRPIGHGIESH